MKGRIFLLWLALSACGRTPTESTCSGAACPCVFDENCPTGQVCVDAICLTQEDFERCLKDGVQPEACNGIDDDCNGVTDDGLSDRACAVSSPLGSCSGVERCGGAAGWICDAVLPSEEVCDRLDNDCDGQIDEGFVDLSGIYTSDEHCGACGFACSEAIPGAESTACRVQGQGAVCQVASCIGDQVPTSDLSRCISPVEALCRVCANDEGCPEGASCLQLSESERVCGRACSSRESCPDGFGCIDGQCSPISGTCQCLPDLVGAQRSCRVPLGCQGVQVCQVSPEGVSWGACDISSASETCDGLDNDCDGDADEDFLVGGRYLNDEHCGVCNNNCVEQWVAEVDHAAGGCRDGVDGPSCVIAECLTESVGGQQFEWVDVNGDPEDGCECRRRAGNLLVDAPGRFSAEPAEGRFQDENCDGVDGVLARAVFVSSSFSGGSNGSREAPYTSITEGLIAARRRVDAYVLVAEGRYAAVVLEEGDEVHGGYSPDFSLRGPRFETEIRGSPALLAERVGSALVSGVVLVGQAGEAAGRFIEVGPQVVLQDSIVRGADGADGANGQNGIPGQGRRESQAVDGASGGAGFRNNGRCIAANNPGGAGGSNQACGNFGRRGGNSSCPTFSFETNPVGGGQAEFQIPSGGDGLGGFDWSFDELSGGGCGHVTESGFPTSIRDKDGQDGRDGAAGAVGRDGVGCSQRWGSFEASNEGYRWVPGAGSAGVPGRAGTGGGGGGAGGGTARFFRFGFDCRAHEIGGSGGGGGAGGCGGEAGLGGQSGGASIGLIVEALNTAGPTLQQNVFSLGRGGQGGLGGFGGIGGEGGRGGFGGQPTSWSGAQGGAGGNGGSGGRGGTGGGGCGGPSIGIVVLGRTASGYAALNTRSSSTERGGRGAPGTTETRGLDGPSALVFEASACGGGCPAGAICLSGLCLPL